MTGVAVHLDGLTRRFGSLTALDGLDLEVLPGELLALLGPSGCGKTTALRLLGGFDRPDAGRVRVGGMTSPTSRPTGATWAWCFQAYSLFPNMNASRNVQFGLRMRKMAAAQRQARAEEVLALVGLADHMGHYPYQLSGGQQQRVALARALAIEPSVLLLDDPLSALDARVRHQLRAEIRSVQQRLGIQRCSSPRPGRGAVDGRPRRRHARRPPRAARHARGDLRPSRRRPSWPSSVGTMNHVAGRVLPDGRLEVLGRSLSAIGHDGQETGTGSIVTCSYAPRRSNS